MQDQKLFLEYVHIACVVAAYWVVSILTVFVNKALLSGETINLNAPLFVTWYQCVISAAICFILSQLSKQFPNHIKFPAGNPLKINVMKKVLPLSVLFTSMIASNNLCLKHVDISFYYIGRSLTTIFNVVFSYMLLAQKTSFSCIVFCLMIISGFWLGVDQEKLSGSFSILGTMFGILGSLSLSLYSIHTKRILPYVNDEVWLLSYYNNVYSCIVFIPLMMVNNEFEDIMNYRNLYNIQFWLIMTVGGLCGFAIGFVTTLQIKVTSPLTHNISGTAKACAQTVLATYWFSVSRTMLWWTSNFIVLAGSAGYARVKQLEMEARHHTQLKV